MNLSSHLIVYKSVTMTTIQVRCNRVKIFLFKDGKTSILIFLKWKTKKKTAFGTGDGKHTHLDYGLKKKMKVIREQFKNSIIFQVWHDSIFVSLFETKIHIDSMRELISALNDKYFNFLLLTSSYMLKNTWRLKSMGIVA